MKYTLIVFTALIVGISAAHAESAPGIGLLVKVEEMPTLRKKSKPSRGRECS